MGMQSPVSYIRFESHTGYFSRRIVQSPLGRCYLRCMLWRAILLPVEVVQLFQLISPASPPGPGRTTAKGKTMKPTSSCIPHLDTFFGLAFRDGLLLSQQTKSRISITSMTREINYPICRVRKRWLHCFHTRM